MIINLTEKEIKTIDYCLQSIQFVREKIFNMEDAYVKNKNQNGNIL